MQVDASAKVEDPLGRGGNKRCQVNSGHGKIDKKKSFQALDLPEKRHTEGGFDRVRTIG
jgi:hypothetical protein